MSGHDALLSGMLQVAVPVALDRLRRKGGPTDTDWEYAHAFAQRLAEHGDAILYRVDTATARTEGRDSASMFAGLANALAVLAYVPGGVKVFGCHFEVPA